MKPEQEYIRDLTEIRTMMERSTRFLSLAGWSGILAGVYALIGAWLAYDFIYPTGNTTGYSGFESRTAQTDDSVLFILAMAILILAIGTAIFLSYRKSVKKNEKLWNPSARRLVVNMAIPLFAGAVFILILYEKGLAGLIPSAMLLFYGMTLLVASKFTYEEMKYLGMIQIAIGLAAAQYPDFGLVFWAFGFGVMHIIYGIYLHVRYEK